MIYLLRHGEIESEGTRRFIGRTDPPLSDRGRNQARFWRDAFSETGFAGIFCSDLMRSTDTARIISENRAEKPQPLADLREIDLGEWDGLAMAEVRKQHPDAWRKRGEELAAFRPPGGESFGDLQARVLRVFDRIAEKNTGDVLIVAHAGVNRVLLCRVLSMDLAHLFRLGQDDACLNLIDTARRPFRTALMNLTPERASGWRRAPVRPRPHGTHLKSQLSFH